VPAKNSIGIFWNKSIQIDAFTQGCYHDSTLSVVETAAKIGRRRRMIERRFDVSFIADLALREKQIQQNYRPIIAVHKWFARRPGTLFRGLLLAEFVNGPLRDSLYLGHNLKGLSVADPFMGGGTPLLEANRLGCDVVGYDINPMSFWIVKQEIEHLDLDAYRAGSEKLVAYLGGEIGPLYRTRCLECGSEEAHVKYFLWVKTMTCGKCQREIALFPGYLISENRRHPKNVLLCFGCGRLNEVEDRKHPGRCIGCGQPLAKLRLKPTSDWVLRK
jgi:adenine-specific DNA methylase